MGARRKDRVRAILSARDLEALDLWVGGMRAPLRLLFSLTYDSDALMRHRAIEAIGRAAAIIAAGDLEKVRVFVRGLIWSMTEESGGIAWYAPEAIAEVCVQVPDLFEEYARLLPQFLEEDAFAPSACAALLRLAPMSSELVGDYAALLIARLEDEAEFQIYDPTSGHLVETTVGQMARQVAQAGGVYGDEPATGAATPSGAIAAAGAQQPNTEITTHHVSVT